MLEDGLRKSLSDNPPVYFTLPTGDKVTLWLDDVSLYQPTVPSGTIGVKNYKIYPTECRQRGVTYKGKITVKLGWSINGTQQETLEKDLGEIPIMIKVTHGNKIGSLCLHLSLPSFSYSTLNSHLRIHCDVIMLPHYIESYFTKIHDVCSPIDVT